MLHQGRGALRARHIKLHESRGAEGGVSCDDNALLLSKVDEVGLLKVGVVLDLERSRGDLGVDEGFVHRLSLVVGDTDASGKALLYQLLHGTPGLLKGGLAPSNLTLAVIEPSWRVTDAGVNVLEGGGEVDEEEIKVVNLPVGKLFAGDRLDSVLVVESLPQLGDDEEILTLHETLLDGAGNTLTTLLLIAIVCISERRENISADVTSNDVFPNFYKEESGEESYFFLYLSFSHEPRLTTCAVKQTVTSLDGVVYGIRCSRLVDLPEAKAHLGHLISAVELKCGSHLVC